MVRGSDLRADRQHWVASEMQPYQFPPSWRPYPYNGRLGGIRCTLADFSLAYALG